LWICRILVSCLYQIRNKSSIGVLALEHGQTGKHSLAMSASFRKINLFSAIPKTLQDVKFTADVNLLVVNEKPLSNASCASRLKQFARMTARVSDSIYSNVAILIANKI